MPTPTPADVNPTYETNIDRTIQAVSDPQTISNLQVMREIPSAYCESIDRSVGDDDDDDDDDDDG